MRAAAERLEAERQRLLAPLPTTPRVTGYAAVSLAASLVGIAPHIIRPRHVVDPYDPVFSSWRLARFAHQLVNDPGRLFDGNIFYPAPYTLTYSDPTFLQAMAGFPFIVAGADPLVVANGLFLLSFPLCALAFFYAAWRLTADPQAACVAGVLGGAAMFKITHYSHFELQFILFIPLALVTMLRMFAAPSRRTGAWFGAMLTAQWLACMYLGMMLLVFLVPIAVVAAIGWRVAVTRRSLAAAAAALVIVVAGGSVTAIPFVRSQPERGVRPATMVAEFSARPRNYLHRSPFLATYQHAHSRVIGNRPEHELFPGAVPLALGAIGVMPPISLATAGLAAGIAIALEGSLGLNGVIYGQLYRYVLPFRVMRVPSRFSAFVGAGLILLSAFGAARLLRVARSGRNRAVVLALLITGALVDARMWLPLQPYPQQIPSIYANVSRTMVLAELPMFDEDIAYMYFSTTHGASLINGYSGYIPAGYERLAEEMKRFPSTDLLQRLRTLGATHVTVNCRFMDPTRCRSLLAALAQVRELELVSSGMWEGAEVRLYAISTAAAR